MVGSTQLIQSCELSAVVVDRFGPRKCGEHFGPVMLINRRFTRSEVDAVLDTRERQFIARKECALE